jgi:hypothetical protein
MKRQMVFSIADIGIILEGGSALKKQGPVCYL